MEPFMAKALKGFFFVVQKCCSNLHPKEEQQEPGGQITDHTFIAIRVFLSIFSLTLNTCL